MHSLFRTLVLVFFACDGVQLTVASAIPFNPDAKPMADPLDPAEFKQRLSVIGRYMSKEFNHLTESIKSLSASTNPFLKLLSLKPPVKLSTLNPDQAGLNDDPMINKMMDAAQPIYSTVPSAPGAVSDASFMYSEESEIKNAFLEFFDSFLVVFGRVLLVEAVRNYVSVELCHSLPKTSNFYLATQNALFPLERLFFSKMQNEFPKSVDSQAVRHMWVHAANTKLNEDNAADNVKTGTTLLLELEESVSGDQKTFPERKVAYSIAPNTWSDKSTAMHDFCNSKLRSFQRFVLLFLKCGYIALTVAQLGGAILIANDLTDTYIPHIIFGGMFQLLMFREYMADSFEE